MDLSTRRLRYFVVLAEELHFTRAAARLFVAQQALSKQIRDLERDIGTALVRRTTRRVELTPAGEEFLAAARTVLVSLDAGIDAARRAGDGLTDRLAVGFPVGAALELTTPILAEFRHRHPNAEVELREFDFGHTLAGLDRWADVAFLRLPIDTTGVDLEIETLFVEPRVVAVAMDHPLAARDSVAVHELLDLPITIGRTDDAAWQRFWALEDHRPGHSPARIVYTNSQTEELEVVATGVACSVTPAGAARYVPHPGVRYIPIRDIPGAPVALAWRRDCPSLLARRFAATARETRDRERDLMRRIESPFGA